MGVGSGAGGGGAGQRGSVDPGVHVNGFVVVRIGAAVVLAVTGSSVTTDSTVVSFVGIVDNGIGAGLVVVSKEIVDVLGRAVVIGGLVTASIFDSSPVHTRSQAPSQISTLQLKKTLDFSGKRNAVMLEKETRVAPLFPTSLVFRQKCINFGFL